MTRRELLASSSVCLAAGMIPRAFSGPINDVDFASALEAAAAIEAKQVSSLELTRRMITRIDKYNPELNAFAYQMRDQAVAQAREADRALSRGDQVGRFHGVPICVKESFGVKGRTQTWRRVIRQALRGFRSLSCVAMWVQICRNIIATSNR